MSVLWEAVEQDMTERFQTSTGCPWYICLQMSATSLDEIEGRKRSTYLASSEPRLNDPPHPSQTAHSLPFHGDVPFHYLVAPRFQGAQQGRRHELLT